MEQYAVLSGLKEMLKEQETLLESFELKKKTYPAGNLIIRKRGQKPEYYIDTRRGEKRIQVPIPVLDGKNLRLISLLAEKRIVLHGLPVLKKNVEAIRTALERIKIYEPESYISLPGELRLPEQLFLPGQINTAAWISDTVNRNYVTNPYHPEALIYETESGFVVRSKSEGQIADRIYRLGLWFRYESRLILKSGKTIYPDFTVLHPTERRLIFIEHFGKMDNPEYAMKAIERLKEYSENGLILGRDVFITMETKDRPLERNQIIRMLKEAGLI